MDLGAEQPAYSWSFKQQRVDSPPKLPAQDKIPFQVALTTIHQPNRCLIDVYGGLGRAAIKGAIPAIKALVHQRPPAVEYLERQQRLHPVTVLQAVDVIDIITVRTKNIWGIDG